MESRTDSSVLPALPPTGTQAACQRLAELLGGAAGTELAAHLETEASRERWLAFLGFSGFAFHHFRRRPAILCQFLTDDPDGAEWEDAAIAERVRAAATEATDRDALGAALRLIRHRVLLRVAYRDLAGLADFDAVSTQLSALAESVLEVAVARVEEDLAARHGRARTRDGEAVTFTVLGMGKLGGRELNFSSDIDLLFTYTAEGDTDGERPVENATFFTRLGRQVVQLLSEPSAEGFAYRVDLRLRPNGDQSPVALPLGAMEQYYQLQGREWERYALIKARPVAGDREQGEQLLATLRPFIYRRYLDFSAVEAVRDLKAQIQREVRKHHTDNLKLGRGGIREVEFVVQAFQLLHGGRQPALRQRATLVVLDELAEEETLPAHDAADLRSAYLFLRRVENHLQMAADRQTQLLPEEPAERIVLARSLGYRDFDALKAELDEHRERVQEVFDLTFVAPQTEEGDEDRPLERLWHGEPDTESAREILAAEGYLEPGRALETLDQFRAAGFLQRLTRHGRERLDRLMPLVIGAAGHSPSPATALGRTVELLEAIGGRTPYFALLAENPVALAQVVRLCGASPFLARFLGTHPVLLDQVLDPADLYACRIRGSRLADRDQEMAGAEDLEERLNALRRFKHSEVLHLAARDLYGQAPLEEVGHGLSEVAELSLEKVTELAWAELTERFGVPQCTDNGERRPVGFAIVGMGKLGGRELGYGSDLDLVFLHDSRGERQETDGGSKDKPLDNGRFFARLGQRIIHFVTTLTAEGALYSIDMRLRPGGKSGHLVPSVDQFRDYELESAWTWEHQALLRGRAVAGDPAVAEGFEAIRHEVLTRERNPEALGQAIREMRARMLAEHGSSDSGTFHLKQDRGGLVDVDFLVQYLCLRFAHTSPAILEPNTRATLRALAAHGHLDADTAERLERAYALYRTLENRIKLFEDRADARITPDPTWREQLDRLVAPEQRPVVERIDTARGEVRAAFDRIVGPPEPPAAGGHLRRSSS